MRITHRGVDSFLLAPDVLVVVDGTRVSHAVRHLEAIPARSILWVQILSSREAAMRWGTSGGNGVIMVATTARR